MARERRESSNGMRPRLLLIEDDEHQRKILKDALLSASFDVEIAEDGQTAWSMIRQNCPDMVLCEATVPGFGGLELLDQICGQERFRMVPFVMMSTDNNPQRLIESVERGADDYLLKPLVMDDLVKRLWKVLEQYGSTPSLQGKLDYLSLPDLMQILGQNRMTGRLEIVRSSGAELVCLFRRGVLLRADEGRSNISGKKAIFRALAQDDGEFRFHSLAGREGLLENDEAGLGPIDFLCMEGLRQRDELEVLLTQIPGKHPAFQWISRVPLAENAPEIQKDLSTLFKKQKRPISLTRLRDTFGGYLDHHIVAAVKLLWEAGFLEVHEEAKISSANKALSIGPNRSVIQPRKRLSTSDLISVPSYHALVAGLLKGESLWVISAVARTITEGIPPEFIYHKMLGGALSEVLRRVIENTLDEPIDLLQLNHTLEQVLDILLPLFAGRPPTHGLVVLGRPIGESGDQMMQVTFLRAAGFGVIDLGSRVAPSRFVDTTLSTGASLLCVHARTQSGAQLVHYIRQLLDKQGMNKIPILVGGAFFRSDDVAIAHGGAAVANDAFDVVRKAYELLKLPFKRS